MKYIDLSYTINSDMPVYPGDIEVSILEDKNYERDKYTSYILKTGLHAGTHIDCPMHITKDRRYISDFDIDRFIGKGVVIDVRGIKEIKMKEEYKKLVNNKEIVVFNTGFESFYGNKEYYEEHPVLNEDLINYLIREKVKVVGFDMPSPDRYPFRIHRMLLEKDIFILENLCNLDKLLGVEKFNISAFPLKLEGEASLVRAVAIVEE